jgi:dihydrofolate reductase
MQADQHDDDDCRRRDRRVGERFVPEGDHDRAARHQFDGSAGMLMGRKTYEGLAGFWPRQTGEWADLLNPLPNLVASRTLQGPPEWNATVIEGDVGEGVSRLKDELDGDLLLIGCGDLANYLLANSVVDELRFWLHPAVWGEGAAAPGRVPPNAAPRLDPV